MESSHLQECTSKCQSWQHASQLIAAITKGSVPQIQSYFECFCKNYFNIVDEFGRTVLHVAVSCGKWQLVKWLLEQGRMDCNSKDLESGYTPLHRSLFYGHLSSAQVLLKHGVMVQVYDNEGLSPLDLVMKDKLSYMSLETGPGEVYTWGDNINYNLGHSSQQTRKHPEVLDIFRKKNISMKQVLLSKFHSIFLSHSGQVYTCGHGHGGRLGHTSEEACLTPKQVSFGYKCTQVAIGTDHTVLLAENRTVWTCGLNTYCQLGHVPPPSKLATPKLITAKVLKNLDIKGICAAYFHTVIYTPDKLFTFGLNAGQLGHPKDIKLQILPGEVSTFNIKDSKIHHVAVSQGATVCTSTKGDVFILHEYQCRKIASKLLNIRKVVIYGGYLDGSRCGDVLKNNASCEPVVLILTESGKLFIWHGDSTVLRRCLFSMTRQLYGKDILLNKNGVLCITKDGEGFMGEFVLPKCLYSAAERSLSVKEKDCRLNSADPHMAEMLNKEECVMINAQRLPFIHRGIDVTSDPNGKNFAIIQAHPSSNLTDIPITLASEFSQHLAELLKESDSTDNIHDVLIKAGNREFSAHKFILASRSDYFKKLFSETTESLGNITPSVFMSDIRPDIFSQLLTFIYTNSCDLLTPGKKFIPSVTKSPQNDKVKHLIYNEKTTAYQVIQQQNNQKDKQKKAKNINNNDNPLRLLRIAAKKLGVQDLITMLDAVQLIDGEVMQINNVDLPKLYFNRNNFYNLYDVCIRSSDGKELECHKCILAARLEYFHSMLTSGWIETKMCNALSLPIPASILNIVLEYIYCDKAPSLIGRTDVEFLCNVLVVADQLLISRLRSMCEIALSGLITLKNAAALLDFSGIYNADQLKATCMQFICLNLAAILEMRTLDEVSEEIMEDLTKAYRDMIPVMCCRIITPYSYGPNYEQLQSILDEYPEYLRKKGSETIIEETIKKTKIKRKSCSQRISIGDEREKSKDDEFRGGRHRLESFCSVKSDITDSDSDVFVDQALSQEIISEMPIDEVTNLGPLPDLSPVAIASSWPPRDAQNTHIPWGRTLSESSTLSPVMDFRQVMELENTKAKQFKISEGKKTSKVSQILKIVKQPFSASLTFGQSTLSEIEKSMKDGKKSPPWSLGEANILNFRDLLSKEEEKRHTHQEAKSRSEKLMLDCKTTPKLFEPSSPPSNPWVKLGSSPQSAICSFNQIVKEEIESKVHEMKLTNKPLTLIQLEEQAMEELLGHYQAFDNPEEYITVERLQSRKINSPIWNVQQTVRTTLGYKT